MNTYYNLKEVIVFNFHLILVNNKSNKHVVSRLLTLWFHYGQTPEVNNALVEGVKTIAIDKWIQVIPQLIARIDTTRSLVGKLISNLLTDIGKQHPQVSITTICIVKCGHVF